MRLASQLTGWSIEVKSEKGEVEVDKVAQDFDESATLETHGSETPEELPEEEKI